MTVWLGLTSITKYVIVQIEIFLINGLAMCIHTVIYVVILSTV